MTLKNAITKRFYLINSRDCFADLLSIGFGFGCSDPWARYEAMFQRYGSNACVDITWSARNISYGPLEYYRSAGYQHGTIDEAKELVRITRAFN
jgi:hypothetical protein